MLGELQAETDGTAASAKGFPMPSTSDINITGTTPLISPNQLARELPVTPAAAATVLAGRQAISDVLRGDDSRMLMIVGPCSIHDETAALEYASRLLKVAKQLEDRLVIVMRTYFEKPRTTIGWKGMLNDPRLEKPTAKHIDRVKRWRAW